MSRPIGETSLSEDAIGSASDVELEHICRALALALFARGVSGSSACLAAAQELAHRRRLPPEQPRSYYPAPNVRARRA